MLAFAAVRVVQLEFTPGEIDEWAGEHVAVLFTDGTAVAVVSMTDYDYEDIISGVAKFYIGTPERKG